MKRHHMIRIFYRQDTTIITSTRLDVLNTISIEDIIWIDLLNPIQVERETVESILGTELTTRQEAEEIESSSKYSEDSNEICINTNFLTFSKGEYIVDPVSFILRKNILLSQRNMKLRSFEETVRKVLNLTNVDGFVVFLVLLETRIDFDADFIEQVSSEISVISRKLSLKGTPDGDLLLKINAFQERTMMLRENFVEKQRILSSILKSHFFPKENYENMRVMIKDVGSLLDHVAFNFERLEYMQNTFLGLIDIEQNRIIKIFTVVTVIFMPPTLIASIYGMNFKWMPELTEPWGYPLALLFMVFSSTITLFVFRRKKWL